jgi:hypothetical protein
MRVAGKWTTAALPSNSGILMQTQEAKLFVTLITSIINSNEMVIFKKMYFA